MQFQVPQFIETEDKIVGPLSLKQFGYVGGAAGIIVLLYFLVTTWLWFLLSLIIAAAGVGLAFIKINGKPLLRVAIAAASFYWRPQIYLWQSENRALPKTEETLKSELGSGFSLEKIIRGMALKKAWRQVELGSQESVQKASLALKRMKERYEVFRGLSGERRVAKRVDYR
jgi:hypothetical protein